MSSSEPPSNSVNFLSAVGVGRSETDVFSEYLQSTDGLWSDLISDEDDEGEDEAFSSINPNRKKRSAAETSTLTEAEKNEKREINREHAKKSRIRKKFLLDSLKHSVDMMERENSLLKDSIRQHMTNKVRTDQLISEVEKITEVSPTYVNEGGNEMRKQEDPDYGLVKTLQGAAQSFVISDPTKSDNPIVYASHGFYALTGYKQEQVLGRNCRFLQGANTNLGDVAKVRAAVARGEEITVVLENYAADGTSFWNQLFVSPLKDGAGKVVSFLGVQCKVTEAYARAYMQSEEAKSTSSDSKKSKK